MIETGAIHICVGTKPTGRLALALSNTRTAAAAQLLAAPENRSRARRLVTLLFGLCPIAQLVAFDTARAAACGCPAPVERTARLAEIAVVLEAIVETIRVFVAEAGQISGIFHTREAGKRIGRLRVRLTGLTETILSLDPCAPAAPEDRERLRAGFASAKALLEEALDIAKTEIYGTSPDAFDLEHNTLDALKAWAREASPFRAAARLFAAELDRPRGDCEIEIPFLPVRSDKTTPAFAEELLNRMLFESGFELAPFWQGSPRLTGTLSRMRDAHPAARALIYERGISPASLLGCRLLELAVALRHAKRLLTLSKSAADRSAEAGAGPKRAYLNSVVWSLAESEGRHREAISLVETARGLLAHAVRLDSDGGVSTLRITSPTEWQFAPYGAGQRMLISLVRSRFAESLPTSKREIESVVRQALFGLDPCVPLEFAYTGEAARLAP